MIYDNEPGMNSIYLHSNGYIKVQNVKFLKMLFQMIQKTSRVQPAPWITHSHFYS